MRRIAGGEAHRVVWRPLLEGKFGERYGEVSMAWLWARLHDRTTELGYIRGGFAQLYAALASAVEAAGGAIRYAARVQAIEPRDGGGLRIALHDEGPEAGSIEVDRVVSTLPPHVTSRLAGRPAEPPGGLEPLSAQCLVLALDRPLTGVYWIGVPGGDAPFLAVVEHTAMADPADYGGRHLVYLGAYRPPADPRLALPLEDQVALAEPLLRTLNPAFERGWITDAWTFAAPNAQPIVDPGYRRRIPPLRTPVPGLWCASMFHVYPHDRGQNYSIRLAEDLATELVATP
jgi:protoporphyrinogen oxidase